MIKFALNKLKEKKYIIQGIIFFLLFLTIYIILDYLNYREADINNKPSNIWVAVNIVLDVIMAFGSMLLMNLSTIMAEIKMNGEKGSNLGFLSVLFGIFTYGCTSCVVTFLAAVGISFSPTIFPFINVWHGILYKILSLVLLDVGLFIVLYNIARGKCRVNLK